MSRAGVGNPFYYHGPDEQYYHWRDTKFINFMLTTYLCLNMSKRDFS